MTGRGSFGIWPRQAGDAAALIRELEQIRKTARLLDRALGEVVIDRRRREIREQARYFAADLRAFARRHDAGLYLHEATACALDVARELPLLGNPYATLVRVRDSGQARERAQVAALRARLFDAVKKIALDFSDLDLSGFGLSGRDLSRPKTSDLFRLWNVTWTSTTTWPPGLAPRVRSREIARGVFRIEPGEPAEPAPVPVPRLGSVDVAFGWRIAPAHTEVSLDAATIGCGADGRALSDKYHVYFNNVRSPCGGIQHRQDELDADSNDDLIRISFRELNARVRKIVFVLSIYDADTRYLSFEQIDDPYVRISGPDSTELAGYGPDGLSAGTSAVLGSLRRHKHSWLFHPVVQEFPSGLVGVSREYGLTY